MTIDDRHLVGVSESEKKRRARLLVDAAAQDMADASNVVLGRRGSTKAEVLVDAGPAIYAQTRKIYRIGERLRPCPGCADCRPDPFFRATANDPVCDFCGAFEDTFLDRATDGTFNEDTSATPGNGLHYETCQWLLHRCDGSGVLPARTKT